MVAPDGCLTEAEVETDQLAQAGGLAYERTLTDGGAVPFILEGADQGEMGTEFEPPIDPDQLIQSRSGRVVGVPGIGLTLRNAEVVVDQIPAFPFNPRFGNHEEANRRKDRQVSRQTGEQRSPNFLALVAPEKIGECRGSDPKPRLAIDQVHPPHGRSQPRRESVECRAHVPVVVHHFRLSHEVDRPVPRRVPEVPADRETVQVKPVPGADVEERDEAAPPRCAFVGHREAHKTQAQGPAGFVQVEVRDGWAGPCRRQAGAENEEEQADPSGAMEPCLVLHGCFLRSSCADQP